MARPLRIEYPGAFYHVTSRGNERKDVFRSRRDREQFLSYLESATERYGTVIHTYCLMSNHYHLLLETPRGKLSGVMQYVNGAYTTYFNVKRRRSGHLFQGRYKAIVVDADEYALELSRYIHLNPVRAGIVTTPEAYEWSSYRAYVSPAPAPGWLKREFILSSFGEAETRHEKYRLFVDDMLENDQENPFQEVVASTLLGRPDFVEEVSARHLAGRVADRSVPAVRALEFHMPVEEVARKVSGLLLGQERLAKKVTMYVCHRYCGEKLKLIGKCFGIGDTAVSEATRRFAQEIRQKSELREIVEKVRRELHLWNVEL